MQQRCRWRSSFHAAGSGFGNPSYIGRRRLLAAGVAALAVPALGRSASARIHEQVVVGNDGWLFPAWDEVRTANLRRIPRVTDLINQAVGVLKQAQIETVVMLMPPKARVYREFLPTDFAWRPEAEGRYAAGLEALRKSGTLVPDLAALMAAQRAARPAELLYLKADTHWTAAGAEAAATETARLVKERLRLPAARGPGMRLGPPASMRQETNDLAELLPATEQARYPIQQYSLRPPVAASGAGALLADSGGDVVVVGNSFMQPKYNFAAMLSSQLDRPVTLFWKIHRFGPYRTMLDYVGGATFKAQRPKLFIWNINEGNLETASDNAGIWGPNAMPAATFLAELRRAVG